MRNGFTLVELAITLAVICVVLLTALPRLGGLYDRVATDAAARDVTTALAVARAAAVDQGTRARLIIAADTLRVDREEAGGWVLFNRWPGPRAQGVGLTTSNPVVVFGPTGMGWGASNTTVVLSRGGKTAKITLSRVGRVKRW